MNGGSTFRVGLIQMRSGRAPAANMDAAAKLIGGIIELFLGFWAAGYYGRSAVLLIAWVAAFALIRGARDFDAATLSRQRGPTRVTGRGPRARERGTDMRAGRLDGKVGWVTWASRGIGREVALTLAREGAAAGSTWWWRTRGSSIASPSSRCPRPPGIGWSP